MTPRTIHSSEHDLTTHNTQPLDTIETDDPMTTKTAASSPRIYVACLASYNSGKLHGEWIDADQDEDTIQSEIAAMLRKSPCPNVQVDCPECEIGRRGYAAAQGSSVGIVYSCNVCNGSGKVPSAEEYAVHDYEGFEGIELGEHPDLKTVVKHATMLAEHDGAWSAYVGNVGSHYATEEDFTDTYQGEYDSPESYAEELIEQTHDLKSMGNLANYIDYEKFARDMGFEGYAFIPGGSGVYVFSPS